MERLWQIIEFMRAVIRRLRFGEISRAPLQVIRLEVQGDSVECDWVARSPDAWDDDLPAGIAERNASVQALEDAMALRELLFSTLPCVRTGVLRAFRQSSREPPQLIITGRVTRQEGASLTVSSLAMRAKLAGLQFWLVDGVLKALQAEESAIFNR
jgi:hypothetical protein